MIPIEIAMSRRVKFNQVTIVVKVTSDELALFSMRSLGNLEDHEVKNKLDRNNLTSRII